MSNVYYGVEPYTGKIICHGGRPKGSKNGYSFGQLVDAAKVAKGKLLANGKYIYDRAASGQLGSRKINGSLLGNMANHVKQKFNDFRDNIAQDIDESSYKKNISKEHYGVEGNKTVHYPRQVYYTDSKFSNLKRKVARAIGTDKFDKYQDKRSSKRRKKKMAHDEYMENIGRYRSDGRLSY